MFTAIRRARIVSPATSLAIFAAIRRASSQSPRLTTAQ
jgi:hypothetical protein